MSKACAALKNTFLEKAKNKDLVIGVIGLGYVGVPLAEAFTRSGSKVVGYDINAKRVKTLMSGKSGMNHIGDNVIEGMKASKLFTATTDIKALKEADALLICVPTPLDCYHHPDLTYVEATCEALSKILRPGHLVVLESTTYPGTTDDIVTVELEKSGLKAGIDFGVAYSPEREDPGNIDFNTSTIPKLIGANTELERNITKAVYDQIVETVMVKDTRTAEAAKLTENIFRWINIGAVNELKMIFEAMDINVWEVIDAAATKPFGFMPFYPGPGVGGHCIRVDPYYLTWKAREHGVSTQFIELAGQVNIAMPRRVVSRLMEELNKRHKKALSGSRVLLCGLSYKRDVDDVRESPSFEVLEHLKENGANVDYYDPHVTAIPHVHEFPHFQGIESVKWDLDKFSKYDAVIVATDHRAVDYEALCKAMPLMIDTRNVSREFTSKLREKVALA